MSEQDILGPIPDILTIIGDVLGVLPPSDVVRRVQGDFNIAQSIVGFGAEAADAVVKWFRSRVADGLNEDQLNALEDAIRLRAQSTEQVARDAASGKSDVPTGDPKP